MERRYSHRTHEKHARAHVHRKSHTNCCQYICYHCRCSEDGGLADFLDSEQLALWPLARGTQDDVRAAGCVYGSLTYGWDLRKRLRPRLAMEDLIADALERVTALFLFVGPCVFAMACLKDCAC